MADCFILGLIVFMRFYEALPQKYAILSQCVVTQVRHKALFRREITDLTGKCYIVTMLLHSCFSIHLKPYAALCCFSVLSHCMLFLREKTPD